MKNYDITIIGGGIAGISAAIYASTKLLRVALIEKDELGGMTFNGGGIFFKYLAGTLKQLEIFERSERVSIISKNPSFHIDFDDLVSKHHIISEQVLINSKRILLDNNVDIYYGEGEIINKNLVGINGLSIHTDNIIIACGAELNIPQIKGIEKAIEEKFVLKPNSLPKLNKIPSSVAIIGGGPVATELAIFFSSVGTKTNLIVRGKQILSDYDFELKEMYLKEISNKNLTISYDSNVIEFVEKYLMIEQAKVTRAITVDTVILATGYSGNPNNFKNIDLDYDEQGIITNDKCETSIIGIYAIGDANNKPKFSNLAEVEGITAVKNILNSSSTINYDYFANSLLTNIEYASYGITEQEAIKRNIKYSCRYFDLNTLVGLNLGSKVEFIKVIFDMSTSQWIGIHVIGPSALLRLSDVIAILTGNNHSENTHNTASTHFSDISRIQEYILTNMEIYDKKNINENMIAYFQPKYNLKTKKIVGCEALTRMNIDGHIVFPLKFIEHYEENGLIVDVDMKCLENTCIFLKTLEKIGLLNKKFKASVNFSAITLISVSSERIMGILGKHQVSPTNIIIEITERVIEDYDVMYKYTAKLKSLGFTISADDFSSGHSSLVFLEKLPIDEVKFDISILPKDENDKSRMEIYTSMAELVSSMGYQIIAEGAETDFQVKYLSSIGVDIIQGYFFSKAVDIVNFVKALRETNY